VGCATAIRFWGCNLTWSPPGLHAPCPRDIRLYAWSTHTFPGSREEARPERLATDPVPGRAQNMRQRRLNRSCGFPVGSRVSKATGVAAADDADLSGRRGRDCVRRSAAASTLQDGPEFFEDVPDNVMLHTEIRECFVRLLAKRQYFALVLHHELV
jgi:hypothetical protein